MTASFSTRLSKGFHRLRQWLTADPYRLALLLLALGYCALFTHLAWEFHGGMRTHRSDLGQIDQAVWNSSRGRFLEQTDNGFVATRLTDHVEPILVIISPVFWLWDDVRALLLLQAAAVAVGVLPLYALALRQFEKYLKPHERTQVWRREPLLQQARPLAFALGAAYLLAPQLQSALLTEFHAAPLAVPLILWALWAVDARRWGQFVAAALLVALVKEEMALLAAGLGLWAIWREGLQYLTQRHKATEGRRAKAQGKEDLTQRRKGAKAQGEESSLRLCPFASLRCDFSGVVSGLLVLLFGLTWFALATFVIVPAYAQPLYGTAESTYFARYGALGDSSADILKSFFTQPQTVWAIAAEPPRVAYLLGLLAAFGWFSLLAPEVLLLSLPLLLANLLSAYPAQYYGEFHYSAPLVAYFAVAAAYGLGRLWRWLARRTEGSSAGFQHLPAASGAAMAAAALLQNRRTALRPLLTALLVLWILAWSGGNYLLHGRGPLGGRYDPTPVTAHHRLIDRFTAQIPPDAAVTATAGVHPHVSHRRYVYQFPLGLDAPVPADWALLDVTTNTDMAPGDLKAQVDRMLAGDWGVVDAADGFLLLHKGAAQKAIPEEFYTFTRLGNLLDSTPDLNGPTPAPTVPPVPPSTPTSTPPGGERPGVDATTSPTPDPSSRRLTQWLDEYNKPLRLSPIEVQDWQRWRQTKLTVTWYVGPTYDPARDAPTLTITTPGGETIATLGTAAPPAIVWYPPEQWQPGDYIEVTTLPLTLPSRFAVTAAGGDPSAPALYVRQPSGYLGQVWSLPAFEQELGAALAPYLGPLQSAGPVQAQLPDGRRLSLRGWLPAGPVYGGQMFDILLQWQLPDGAEDWLPDLSVFVHLRHDGGNLMQADGAPQMFGLPSPPVGNPPFLNDWRQLTLDTECLSGQSCEVYVGVYNPATGERLPLVDEGGAALGDELRLGAVQAAPAPPPDQACALVGACLN